VDTGSLGVTPNSVEKDCLADTTQPNQHCAFCMPANPGTLQRHTHFFEQRVAARKLERRRSRTRDKRIADRVHLPPRL
jgi:hypothetical protein